jgi:hypothetical protein
MKFLFSVSFQKTFDVRGNRKFGIDFSVTFGLRKSLAFDAWENGSAFGQVSMSATRPCISYIIRHAKLARAKEKFGLKHNKKCNFYV